MAIICCCFCWGSTVFGYPQYEYKEKVVEERKQVDSVADDGEGERQRGYGVGLGEVVDPEEGALAQFEGTAQGTEQ